MKISQITITASRTINLGNYESLRVEGSATINIEEDKTCEQARALAIAEVKQQMQETALACKPKGK